MNRFQTPKTNTKSGSSGFVGIALLSVVAVSLIAGVSAWELKRVDKQQKAIAQSMSAEKLSAESFSSAKPAVLGTTTQNYQRYFEVNVPSVFHGDVQTQNTTVNGTLTLKNNVNGQNANIDLGNGKITAGNVVYSLQGKAGNVKLEAGEGIKIDGLKISSTNQGSVNKSFGKVKTDNNTIEAREGNDLLTLVGSGGVTVTANPGARTITIETGEINLGTDTNGDYVKSLEAGTGMQVSATSGEGTMPRISLYHLGLQTLTAPSSDKIYYYDNITGTTKWLAVGTGLNIADNTLSASAQNYTASGNLLQLSGTAFSVKEGTLTNNKLCVYNTTSGIICNTNPGDVGASYSAGNDLDLTGTEFSLQSTIDTVTTINLAGTGTLNGLDAFDATTKATLENGLNIAVPHGGTGATTLTGLLLGNGQSAITGITLSSGVAGAISDETGSGALVFATAPAFNTSISVTAGSAPTTDIALISNAGNGTVTNGADGLSIDFTSTADSASDTNSGINIAFTPSGDSGDTGRGINIATSGISAGSLYGINIAGITGGTGTETALVIGSGWDKAIDASGIISTTVGVITPKLYPSADSTTAIQINKADGTTNVLNVDTTNARVGIGTTSPTTALQIDGDLTVGKNSFGTQRKIILEGNGTDEAYIQLRGNESSGGSYGLDFLSGSGTRLYAYGTDSIVFGSMGYLRGTWAEKMRITGAGNVGIGTTSPSALIHGIKTTEQLRLGYDASNYYSTTVASTGRTTLNSVGSDPGFTLNNAQILISGASFVKDFKVRTNATDALWLYRTSWGSYVLGSDAEFNITANGDTIYFGANYLSFINSQGNAFGPASFTPYAPVHVIKTTEQLRLGYDASNYYSTTVGSTGLVTYDAVGTGSGFQFNDPIYDQYGSVLLRVTGSTTDGWGNTTLRLGTPGASGDRAVGGLAIGWKADLEGAESQGMAIGNSSFASRFSAAIGHGATASPGSLAIGNGAVATGTNNRLAIAWGSYGQTGYSIYGDTSGNVSFPGNVGIGTTSPAVPLNLANTTGDKIYLYGGSSGDQYGFGIQAHELRLITGGSGGIFTFGTQTSGSFTEKVRIDQNGNVGIGTTSPATKLDTYLSSTGVLANIQQSVSSNGLALSSGTYGNGNYLPGMVWYTTDASTKPKAGIWAFTSSSGSYLQFGTSNNYATGITNTAMVVDYSGNVGIGTMSPGNRLTVTAPTTADALADVMIGTSATTQKGLVIQGKASQTANLFEAQLSTGAIKASINSAGDFTNSQGYTDSEVFGNGATAGAANNIVIGKGSTGPGNQFGIIIGRLSGANTGGASVGIGGQIANTGAGSIGIGYQANAGGSGAMAFGYGSSASNAGQLSFGSDSYPINDVYIGNAGSFGNNGRISGTPAGFTLNAIGGSGTNIAGAALQIAGGKATGNAVGGPIYFQTSDARASGTALQSLTTKMTILASGNVGIGTTSPNVPLDFGLTLGNKIGLYGGAYGIGIQSNVLQIFANNIGDRVGIGYNPSSFIENFSVMATGNIGIGTTSPTNILSLGGTAARTIWMERNTTAATAGQGLTLSSGGAIAGTADLAGGDLTLKSGISTGTGTSAIHFYTATAGSTGTSDNTPTEKMTILGSGSVGIGTTAPYSKLDVIGSNSIHIAGTAVDSGGYFDTAGSNAFYLSGGAKYSSYTSDYVFTAKETSASGQIMENGNSYFYGNSGLTAGNTFTPTKIVTIIGASSVANTLYLSGGKVGIGTSGTPAQKLEVNGSIRMGALITGAGGAVAVYRDANGDLADSTSSIRYKTNVAEMEPIMSKIMALKTVRFNWNDQTSTPGMADFGMISEEVDKVLPELVTYEADGTTPHGLKYEKMGLFALKGLQEQQGQIDTITARLEALEAQGTIAKGAVAGADTTALLTALENDLVKIKELVTEKITAKTAKVEGLEMVDRATKDVYCTWIENGDWKKEKGNCDEVMKDKTVPVVDEPAKPSVDQKPADQTSEVPPVVPPAAPPVVENSSVDVPTEPVVPPVVPPAIEQPAVDVPVAPTNNQ